MNLYCFCCKNVIIADYELIPMPTIGVYAVWCDSCIKQIVKKYKDRE